MYRLITTYKGFDPKLDNDITKTIGRKDSGRGYCFVNDTRDLDFQFTRLYGLVNAQMRIKDKFKRKVTAKIYDRNGDEIHPNSKILKGK